VAGGSAPAPPSPTGPSAAPAETPLALVADVRGTPRVVALDRAATRRGIAAGMALSEARALAGDLRALPWDADYLARAALDVTTALLAASPRVAWASGSRSVPPRARAPVPPAGGGGEVGIWWVDAAGLGSERKLVEKLRRLAGGLGFGPARVGVADSAIAAHAATYGGRHGGTGARGHGSAASRPTGEIRRPRDAAPAAIVPPGSDAAFLAPFPIALLDIDDDLAETLRALGLETLGQFAGLDADEVEARFGTEGLAAHRLARGLDARGPSTPRDDAIPIVACDLGGPVATAEPLLFVLKGAIASLGSALRAKGLAAREVSISLGLDDGALAEKAVRPALPTSHEGALFDHCRTALEGWTLPEPVVALTVRAAVTVTASGEQGDLLVPRWADPAALEAAFERIRGSEGADAVATPLVRDGHLPRDAGAWGAREDTGAAAAERRTRSRTAASTHGAQPGTPPGPREHRAAALRLLQEPAPVRVRLGRAGIEAFHHEGAWHDVAAWSGPERLAPRWWVGGEGPQDRYTARAADGSLWLLFRAAGTRRWFVEGWWD